MEGIEFIFVNIRKTNEENLIKDIWDMSELIYVSCV